MSDPAIHVRHGGRWTEISIPELLRMVDAATELADAALVRRVREAVIEGQQVFQTAFHPGPNQGKAIVAAHLLRYLMDRIEAGRATQTITVEPEAPAAPAAPKVDGPLPCAGTHPHDLPCDVCIDVWEAKRAERLKAAAAAPPPAAEAP